MLHYIGPSFSSFARAAIYNFFKEGHISVALFSLLPVLALQTPDFYTDAVESPPSFSGILICC